MRACVVRVCVCVRVRVCIHAHALICVQVCVCLCVDGWSLSLMSVIRQAKCVQVKNINAIQQNKEYF